MSRRRHDARLSSGGGRLGVSVQDGKYLEVSLLLMLSPITLNTGITDRTGEARYQHANSWLCFLNADLTKQRWI